MEKCLFYIVIDLKTPQRTSEFVLLLKGYYFVSRGLIRVLKNLKCDFFFFNRYPDLREQLLNFLLHDCCLWLFSIMQLQKTIRGKTLYVLFCLQMPVNKQFAVTVA